MSVLRVKSKGKVLDVLVDEKDMLALDGMKFHVNVATGYAQENTTKQYLHRMIANTPRGGITDHINRNRLDNRRANLRVVDGTGNMLNVSPKRNCSSRYKGVHKHLNGWRAKFQHRGIRYEAGVHHTELEAHTAYLVKRERVLLSQ